VVKFGEFIMILELHRQGLKVAAIARQLGIDRKTVRKYISRGLEPPTYGPRPRRQKSTDPFLSYLRERLAAFPGLTAVRLWREMRERGYPGGYTAVKRAVRDIRPEPIAPFEVRFETPPGEQAQVDLARFEVEFADEPGVTRIGLATTSSSARFGAASPTQLCETFPTSSVSLSCLEPFSFDAVAGDQAVAKGKVTC
jgi:transposase